MLIGGLSAGLTSCGPSGHETPPTTGDVYTNNHSAQGLGYYHAPFRAWFPLPYNHYDPEKKLYFNGGQWTANPHESITNISPPLQQVLNQARSSQGSHTTRTGFGSTSQRHSTWS